MTTIKLGYRLELDTNDECTGLAVFHTPVTSLPIIS